MGTEKEQAVLTWEIRGPDGDGCVWLDIDQPHELNSVNLGSFADVGERLCDWLAQNDYGDRPCPTASS